MLCAWDWDLSNEHFDYPDMSWLCLEYSWSKSRDKTCSEESARSGISWVFWKRSCGLILLVESLKLWFFAVWTFSRWVRGSFWSPPTWQRWPVESEPTSLVCTLQLSSMWWVLCCLVIEAKTRISCCAPYSHTHHEGMILFRKSIHSTMCPAFCVGSTLRTWATSAPSVGETWFWTISGWSLEFPNSWLSKRGLRSYSFLPRISHPDWWNLCYLRQAPRMERCATPTRVASRPRAGHDTLLICEGVKVWRSPKVTFWSFLFGPSPEGQTLQWPGASPTRPLRENTWGARISPSNGESFWHLWRKKTYFLFFFGTFWVSIVGEVHSMLPLRCECQACDRAQDTHTTRLRHGARLGMMRGSSRDHVIVCICTYGHLQTHWFWWFFGC